MKEQKLIIEEVKEHLQASARKNKYPVDVEYMYINCDERDEFYNETVTRVAQAILEAEQIKEA